MKRSTTHEARTTKHLVATYRLQLHAGFDFDQAAALVPYLRALGISHIYASPVLQACPGSTHGYDVVDPTRANEELGGEAGFAHLASALREAQMGLVLDIVPNHMAIVGRANPWWWDVLENGPASRYAHHFSVDWDFMEVEGRNRVLLPVLGDHYGRVLEAGELELRRDGGTFCLHYYDHVFPVAPRSLDALLERAAQACGSALLGFFADSYARLPSSHARDRRLLARRHRNKEVLRDQLGALCVREPAVAAAVDAQVARLNADADALDALLARQNYRLAFWRMSEQALGYRRFFDIDTLIGMQPEDEVVFADLHDHVLGWLERGLVDGLRIDHVDGLRDPRGYLERLRAAVGPEAWLVVEKILEPGERLPERWPVAGTTGYDFLNLAGGLFVDPEARAPIDALYEDVAGVTPDDFEDLVYELKARALRELLGSDVHRLTSLLALVCARHRRHRDYTTRQLEDALVAFCTCLPVYRTYVRVDDEGEPEVSEQDVAFVEQALARAAERQPELDATLLGFLRDLLLLRVPGELELELAWRVQQLTGPAMAKGVEDTAFYVFNRFVALNEVGGDPTQLGRSVEAFHADCLEAQRRWPQRMLTVFTHDTKRSADVRMRLSVLSEIPGRWQQLARRWLERNARHREGDGLERNMEFLVYQTLVGAWPIDEARLCAYLQKAAREAKQHTSWLDPDEAWEDALLGFARRLLGDAAFTAELEALVGELEPAARVNALALTLLELTAPGVPDLYQGSELWNHSLVDPDNRRPVDFDQRRQLLETARGLDASGALARSDEGLPRLWLIQRALELRRALPGAFGREAKYQALESQGRFSGRVVAFARSGNGQAAVTVVPRLSLRTAHEGGFGDTALELPAGRWRDVLGGAERDGGAVRVTELFDAFPVALLRRV